MGRENVPGRNGMSKAVAVGKPGPCSRDCQDGGGVQREWEGQERRRRHVWTGRSGLYYRAMCILCRGDTRRYWAVSMETRYRMI